MDHNDADSTIAFKEGLRISLDVVAPYVRILAAHSLETCVGDMEHREGLLLAVRFQDYFLAYVIPYLGGEEDLRTITCA